MIRSFFHLTRQPLIFMMMLAGSALAGPDFLPYQPANWADSVVPNHTDNQTFDSNPLPSAIPGDQISYFAWANANLGDANGGTGYLGELHVDGTLLATQTSAPASGTYWGSWNAALEVSGGRHTVWQNLDVYGAIAENNESNNAYARQFVWTPISQSPNTTAERTHPPDRNAGRTHVPSGTNSYDNVDAISIPSTASGYWIVAAASVLEPGPDYDVRSYRTAPTFESGLDGDYDAASTAGGSSIDGVLINRNNLSDVSRTMAVLNYSTGTSPYLLDHRQSGVVRYLGSDVVGTMAENQVIQLEEFYVGTEELGSATFVLETGLIGQQITLALYGPSFEEGNIYGALQTVTTDDQGRAILTRELTESDYHCLAFYRNAHEGTSSFEFTLKLRRTPADIAAMAIPGSYAPLVPYVTLQGGVGDPQPAPEFLLGDTANTNLYHQIANIGAQDSGIFQVAYQFDGVQVGEIEVPGGSMPADPSGINVWGIGPYYMPGGRHTITMINDSQDSIEEIYEDNNHFSGQWMWSRRAHDPDTSEVRGAPPLREGGHEHIPADVTRRPNLDGFLTQTFTIEGDVGYWGAVAIQPSEDVDLDLLLFERTQGPLDGFVDQLEVSAQGLSRCDFILLDFDDILEPVQAFDVGVMSYNGQASYLAQSTRSTEIGTIFADSPGSLGTFSLESDQILNVLEVYVPDGSEETPLNLRAENLAGSIDLFLSVHQRNDTGYQSRASAMAATFGDGPGQGATLTVSFPESGYYGIILAKNDHGDYGASGQFELVVTNPAFSDTPDEPLALPRATGITSVYPNPFNPQTTVRFAMSQPGPASVQIFDIKGRLVKTLQDGNLEAGHHEMTWLGKDQTGRDVPSGVYFVRASHSGGHDSHRIALVK